VLIKVILFLMGSDMLEKDIQHSLTEQLKYLENLGKCIVIRNNSFKGRIMRSNGSFGYISNNKPGASDLIVIGQNKVYFVECKRPGGKQSQEQKEFELKIIKLGHQYMIIDDLEVVSKFVQSLQ
jgi:hypothetical protein